MPRYSRSGLIAAGIAGNIVSRAGKFIAKPAGGACWFDDQEMIYARKIGEPDVWALRAHDGMVEIAKDEKGATELRAGGGVWAAELGGPGVRSNRHPFLPLAGLRDVGPDGTLAYCRDRQVGLGLILRALDGATTTLVTETAACRDVQVHNPTQATWIQGGRIRSSYGDPVTPDGRCGVPRVVTLAGKRLLLYWHEDSQGERLLLQTEWGNPVGYVLTKPGQVKDGKADWPAFRPDLIALSEVKACWSITEAEGPTSIRERVIDLSRPTVDLRRPVEMTKIDRPLWCGFFEFEPATLPGNCELVQWSTWQWRLMAGGRQVAVYVSGEPDGSLPSLETNIAKVKPQGVPVIAYWPRSLQAGPVPKGADWVGVESYRSKDDSLSTCEAKVRAAVAKCPKAVLIAQCYTSNTTLTADLASLVPVYARIAKECANVVGILTFSGSGRPTGLQDHPEVKPLWQELADGIPSPPEVEDDEMNKPVVKVTRFDGLIQRDGWRMEMEDAGNPGVKVQLFTEDGGLRVKFINPAGSNTSGAQRKVLA